MILVHRGATSPAQVPSPCLPTPHHAAFLVKAPEAGPQWDPLFLREKLSSQAAQMAWYHQCTDNKRIVTRVVRNKPSLPTSPMSHGSEPWYRTSRPSDGRRPGGLWLPRQHQARIPNHLPCSSPLFLTNCPPRNAISSDCKGWRHLARWRPDLDTICATSSCRSC